MYQNIRCDFFFVFTGFTGKNLNRALFWLSVLWIRSHSRDILSHICGCHNHLLTIVAVDPLDRIDGCNSENFKPLVVLFRLHHMDISYSMICRCMWCGFAANLGLGKVITYSLRIGKEVVLDMFWVKHWEYKSSIIF